MTLPPEYADRKTIDDVIHLIGATSLGLSSLKVMLCRLIRRDPEQYGAVKYTPLRPVNGPGALAYKKLHAVREVWLVTEEGASRLVAVLKAQKRRPRVTR